MGGEGLAEGVAADDTASDADVGNEQVDEAVEVAAVQTDRVAGDQLSDVGFRLEPFDRAAHAPPPSRLSAQPPGVRPSVRTRREANRQVPSTRT